MQRLLSDEKLDTKLERQRNSISVRKYRSYDQKGLKCRDNPPHATLDMVEMNKNHETRNKANTNGFREKKIQHTASHHSHCILELELEGQSWFFENRIFDFTSSSEMKIPDELVRGCASDRHKKGNGSRGL